MIGKGESQEVKFQIKSADLAFVTLDGSWAAEAGEFMLMLGSASNDIRLNEKFTLKD